MSDVGPITELCERWEEARRAGRPVTPEELCAGRPDLLPELRRAVRALAAADARLDTGPVDDPPPSGAPRLPPDGRYEIRRFLAEGGLGRVYVGYDTALGRPVALKVIRPDRLAAGPAAERFEREAAVTGSLEHPNIPPVYDLFPTPGGELCYVMRLLPGRTLQAAADEAHAAGRDPARRADDLRRLVRHFAAVCRTVGFAHARGVVHRDLKPGNVMVGPGGETWVLDWGLAKRAADPAGPPVGELTAAGAVVGTPAYMAPEQAAGAAHEVGPAADVYALGGILYYLLTGRPPHAGRSAAEVLRAALTGRVRPAAEAAPGAPAALAAAAHRALAPHPADRFPSADALAAAVEAWLDPPSRPTGRRVGPPALVAAVVAAAGLAVAAVTLGPWVRQGAVEIEAAGPGVRVEIEGGGGDVTVLDPQSHRRATLPPGMYRARLGAGGDGWALTPDTFTLGRGGTQIVRVVPRPPAPPADQGPGPPGGDFRPGDPVWQAGFDALPAAERVRRFEAAVKARNPAFAGEFRPVFEGGNVIELHFRTGSRAADVVTDLTPVAALRGLRSLTVNRNDALPRTPLDLTPLRGLGLKYLNLWGTGAADLTPLRGMPLTFLSVGVTQVSDLAPLAGMPLSYLDVGRTRVADLGPLRGMRLTTLLATQTPVSDLAPLAGMPLVRLDVRGTRIADLSPLRGLPLRDVRVDDSAAARVVLKEIPTVTEVNERPAAEFWRATPPR